MNETIILWSILYRIERDRAGSSWISCGTQLSSGYFPQFLALNTRENEFAPDVLDFLMKNREFWGNQIEETIACAHLLTDMVAAIKSAVDAAAARTGRSLELIVRVPPTVTDCHRIGIEITRWVALGLVDVVVAGEGWIPHTSPIAGQTPG